MMRKALSIFAAVVMIAAIFIIWLPTTIFAVAAFLVVAGVALIAVGCLALLSALLSPLLRGVPRR
jgi:hypothetical protein